MLDEDNYEVMDIPNFDVLLFGKNLPIIDIGKMEGGVYGIR